MKFVLEINLGTMIHLVVLLLALCRATRVILVLIREESKKVERKQDAILQLVKNNHAG